MAQEVSSESQFNSAIASGKLTVVDFYADWCGPCKAIAPEFERLSNSLGTSVQCLKVNVDKLQSVASKWSVTAMPTFLLFKSGAKIGTVVGADLSKLKRLIETHKGAASGFPQSGGRVLGSGEKPSRFASSSSSASSLFKRLDGNAVFFGLLALFIMYLYMTNTDGASGSRGPRAPPASHGGEF